MKIFSGKPLHIHFKCSKCDSIIDIDNKDLNLEYIKLNKKVEKENNLDVFDVNIMLIGTCSKCKCEIKLNGTCSKCKCEIKLNESECTELSPENHC